jgi:hypothetical protein
MPTTTINLTGQALSKVDDTNVTLTLGGTPLTALLKATSLTLGWTGTLADARIASAATWNAKESALTFSTGLTRTVNTITIDSTVVTLTGAQALSNKTGLISQWTNDSGYLTSLAGAVTSVTGSGNIASSGGATPNITFTGVLPAANGGTATNILTTALALGTASSVAGQLTLQNATNAFTQTIRGTNPVASITYDLPTTAPTAGQVLSSTAPAAGVVTLSWATAASGLSIGDTIGNSPVTGSILMAIGTTLTQSISYRAQQATPFSTAFGFESHISASFSGINNTSFGYQSGKGITSGINNTNDGYLSGTAISTGSRNTNYGSRSGERITTQNDNTCIGYLNGVYGPSESILIGSGAGFSTGADATKSIVIATNPDLNNLACTSCINIAYRANSATASFQGLLGSNDAGGHIDNWYFNGITHTAPYSVTLNSSAGSGTNIAGAAFTIAGGKGTGNAAGGNIIFQTSTKLGSGTTLQTLATRLTISGGAATTGASTATWADALDFVFGSTTGTKIGTATTQKLSFWNATPIIQPTTAVATSPYTHVPSTAVHEDSTFDGYKLGQVVKALRELGILA